MKMQSGFCRPMKRCFCKVWTSDKTDDVATAAEEAERRRSRRSAVKKAASCKLSRLLRWENIEMAADNEVESDENELICLLKGAMSPENDAEE